MEPSQKKGRSDHEFYRDNKFSQNIAAGLLWIGVLDNLGALEMLLEEEHKEECEEEEPQLWIRVVGLVYPPRKKRWINNSRWKRLVRKLRSGESSIQRGILGLEDDFPSNAAAVEDENVSLTGSIIEATKSKMSGLVNEMVDPRPDPGLRDDGSLVDRVLDEMLDDDNSLLSFVSKLAEPIVKEVIDPEPKRRHVWACWSCGSA